MKTDREKLVELQVQAYNADNISKSALEHIDFTTDFLIAHDVTVQEWIPASEPPKESGYYLCVVCVSKEYRRMILFWEDNVWIEMASCFRTKKPLYWMPLPQPPKGE